MVLQCVDHSFQGVACIGQVVNQQHAARNFALGSRDEAGNVQSALNSACIGTVRTGGHDGQWLVENAAQDVARTQAPTREAQDGVELPARQMDLERELFDQVVVLVIGHVQVLAVFCQHGLLRY